MIRFTIHKVVLILILLTSVIGCDQVTKTVVRDSLKTPLSYFGDTIRLQRAQNPGAFLSMGESLPPALRFFVFTILVGIVLTAGLWILFRSKQMSTLQVVGLSLAVAGGIGNLIDRVLFGTVTDFLNFGFGPVLRTGILNIADLAIVFGCVVFGWTSMKVLPNSSSEPPRNGLGEH